MVGSGMKTIVSLTDEVDLVGGLGGEMDETFGSRGEQLVALPAF